MVTIATVQINILPLDEQITIKLYRRHTVIYLQLSFEFYLFNQLEYRRKKIVFLTVYVAIGHHMVHAVFPNQRRNVQVYQKIYSLLFRPCPLYITTTISTFIKKDNK